MEENTKNNIDPSSTISEMGNRKRVRPLGAKRDEVHNIERERRKKITQMFTHLRTTVPSVFPKATREVILNETIEYIKELEKKKKMLEDLKEKMKSVEANLNLLIPCGNRNNSSVMVTVSSNVAFFGIQSVAKPGLVTVILKVFFNNQAEILAANVSVDHGNLILAITALIQHRHGNSATVEKIKREILSL